MIAMSGVPCLPPISIIDIIASGFAESASHALLPFVFPVNELIYAWLCLFICFIPLVRKVPVCSSQTCTDYFIANHVNIHCFSSPCM